MARVLLLKETKAAPPDGLVDQMTAAQTFSHGGSVKGGAAPCAPSPADSLAPFSHGGSVKGGAAAKARTHALISASLSATVEA